MKTESLKCILLIDDDPVINLYNEKILSKNIHVDHIEEVHNGAEAMKYLRDASKGLKPFPELIFLDISMPRMNGWEFLYELEQFQERYGYDTDVIMLTTSLNLEDKFRAEASPLVTEFISKPLRQKTLKEILRAYFPDYIKVESLRALGIQYG